MKPRRERGQGSIGRVKGSRFLYIWYYTSSGQQVRESTKSTLRSVAQEMLNQRLAAMARGERSPQELRSIRYEDMRAAYLANCKLTGKCPGKLVLDEHGTPTGMTKTGLASVDKFFKGMRLPQIDTAVMQAYRDSRKCSDSMKNRDLSLLRAMMNVTIRERRLQFTTPHFPMASEAGNARKGFLEPEQFAALRDKMPEGLWPYMTFFYETGCRPKATRAIVWEWVNLDEGMIYIPDMTTKTKDPLPCPMSPELVLMLRKRFRSGPVFDTAGFRGAFDEAKKAAGMPWLLSYDMRRSAVRNMIRAGVHETVAMKISGHKTRSVFDRYNITSVDDVKDAMRKTAARNADLMKKAK